MMNAGPTVSLAEAARHSPRSTATLRRWLAVGTIAGAERNAAGAWVIPVAALVEAGAWPSTTPPGPGSTPPDTTSSTELADALAQVEALTARATAAERQADLERQLREAAERNTADLRAGRTYDEPTPQPAPHLKGLVMRRHQEALLALLLVGT